MNLQQSIRYILVTSALTASVAAQAEQLEEIQVNADFYQTPALELGSSVSVIDDIAIEERGAEHLEQVLNLAPNVNYSAGASRGRFIQIRGIGERSQFVAPINPSVGILIDGIDFTGIGTAASLLDVQQVEILRGPQGTLHGANALAGLINIVSKGPTETTEGKMGVTFGEYGTRVFKVAVGGQASESVGLRLAAQHTVSDGYIENDYLNRDDTSNIDEAVLRGKLQWQATDALTFDFTAFLADIDNGYDAFSLDNNRKTLSDQPGADKQDTNAGAVKATWKMNDSAKVIATVSHADSELEYGYDEDWAYPELCTDFECAFGPDSGYSSYDNYLRDNKNTSVDVRTVFDHAGTGTQWVLGAYLRDQDVDLTRIYTYADGPFSSQYETANRAIYGQVEYPRTSKATLIAGLRFENYTADYTDSEGFNATPEEDLVGGKLGVEYQTSDNKLVYGLVSRGYKAGGFNADDEVPENRREFKSESMWNYEVGVKNSLASGRVQTQVSVFYQDREDIQAKQYFEVQDGGTGITRFVDFIDNAASGSNYGVEAELLANVSDQLSVFASLGLLRTEFDDFSYFDADGNETVKDGRDQAHAPHYQYALGTNYQFNPSWMLRVEIEGKDEFYFSDSHDQKSDSYNLLNARLSYFHDNLELALWGRNLTDQDYQVRGFEFGNDPRDGYATHAYHQFGEPRIVGVSANYTF